MKRILLLLFLLAGAFATLSAATLEASTRQAVYPGTNIPRLTIVSGSGKTSYVSGVIDDPNDPAATVGIWFNAPTGSTLTFKSSKTSVVKVADITVEEIESGLFAVRIKPSGVGTSKITVSLSGASDYFIEYAANKGSSQSQTTWLTNIADASAMAPVGDGYIYIADDETNVLRLYNTALSGKSLAEIDATSMANGKSGEEFDIECATVSEDGNTIYWLASLTNSKKGKEKPYRNRAFSTSINGAGATATLSAGAYSEQFRNAMIAFGDANGWNFTASASYDNEMIPKRIDGFNVEGLTLKKGGGAAYVAFRAPCVPKKGVTPTSSNRQYAVMAPVSNFENIFTAKGKSSVKPQTGDPVLFDFGGLGIRSIERVGDYYVIIAGLFEGGGTPKMYLWDGTTLANAEPIVPGTTHLTEMNLPIADLGDGSEGHPEALIARQEGNELVIDIITDSGSADLYDNGKENKDYSSDKSKYPWAKFRLDVFRYQLPVSNHIGMTEVEPDVCYRLAGQQLTLTGLPSGTPVSVVTVDGKVVGTATADGAACTLRLPDAQAVYIVKTPHRSFKIQTPK